MTSSRLIIKSTDIGELVRAREEQGNAVLLFLVHDRDKPTPDYATTRAVVDGIVERPSDVYCGGGLVMRPSHRTDKYRQGV